MTESYSFVVITRINELEHNLAMAWPLYLRSLNGKPTELPIARCLDFLEPVFHVGEILIVNQDGREVGYPRRKPDKWGVECEVFTDIAQAHARARAAFDTELEQRKTEVASKGVAQDR